MPCRPPRIAEKIAALLIPPFRREEVLGDLRERCTSSARYCLDVLRVIPWCIARRIRRVGPVLVLQAMLAYLSFFFGAWIANGALPADAGELWHFAIPAAVMMLGVVLAEVYRRPAPRAPFPQLQGPCLGYLLLNMPRLAAHSLSRATVWGEQISVVLLMTVSFLFSPPDEGAQAANGFTSRLEALSNFRNAPVLAKTPRRFLIWALISWAIAVCIWEVTIILGQHR